MHSLIHEEYARVVAHEEQRHRGKVDDPHGPGPPQPKRVRGVVAVWLVATANRVDREAARRAIA
jgi:hypothetical protein